MYLAEGIFAPPSVLYCAIVLLSSVLAVCLGICSKYQKIQCLYNTFTYIYRYSNHIYFFYVKFWTLLEVITEVCSSVIIFIVSVCCKYILCLEENHQREASSLNKSPCPRYERPSFRGQLQGCLHECFKQYDTSYYITTSCLLIDRPHYISIFLYCMCLDAI